MAEGGECPSSPRLPKEEKIAHLPSAAAEEGRHHHRGSGSILRHPPTSRHYRLRRPNRRRDDDDSRDAARAGRGNEDDDDNRPLRSDCFSSESIVSETAETMRSAVREYVARMRDSSPGGEERIKLVGILATTAKAKTTKTTSFRPPMIFPDDDDDEKYRDCDDTHGNERYSEQIASCCAKDGILYELRRVEPTREDLEFAIREANENTDVHGILVFYPIFDRSTSTMAVAMEEEENGAVVVDAEASTSSSSSVGGRTPCREGETQRQRRLRSTTTVTGVGVRRCGEGGGRSSMDDHLRNLVARHKDVEGYRGGGGSSWTRKRVDGDEDDVVPECGDRYGDDDVDAKRPEEDSGPVIRPCTALAVYKILESLLRASSSSFSDGSSPTADDADDVVRDRYVGATMTIINRSEVLGRPLAVMLSERGATVYSVDVNSVLRYLPDGTVRREIVDDTTVERCVRGSSVVVSGVPSDSFRVPTEWISDNAIVINVATTTTSGVGSNFDEGTLLGDDGARGVIYVPHVGRVTVAALEYNLMRLHERNNAIRRWVDSSPAR